MIDIWFLFLLILVVLTIIFHTIITIILGPESAENKTFASGKKIFSRRTHSAATQNGSATFIEDDDDSEVSLNDD